MEVKIEDDVYDTETFVKKQRTKGRPRLILTDVAVGLIERLAKIMCTEEEIGEVLQLGYDTLHSPHNIEVFQSAIKRGKNRGKESLRRKQWKLADNNASMAIFLGKQYLGQSDVGLVTEDSNDILKGLTTVAQLISHPKPNRTIEDVE